MSRYIETEVYTNTGERVSLMKSQTIPPFILFMVRSPSLNVLIIQGPVDVVSRICGELSRPLDLVAAGWRDASCFLALIGRLLHMADSRLSFLQRFYDVLVTSDDRFPRVLSPVPTCRFCGVSQSFSGRFAIVMLCRIRQNNTTVGIPIRSWGRGKGSTMFVSSAYVALGEGNITPLLPSRTF